MLRNKYYKKKKIRAVPFKSISGVVVAPTIYNKLNGGDFPNAPLVASRVITEWYIGQPIDEDLLSDDYEEPNDDLIIELRRSLVQYGRSGIDIIYLLGSFESFKATYKELRGALRVLIMVGKVEIINSKVRLT